MINVEIEDPDLMLHVIYVYLDGLKEAKELSMDDSGTLDTMDKMLDSMALYDENEATLLRLKEAIIRGNGITERTRRRTRSFIRLLRTGI